MPVPCKKLKMPVPCKIFPENFSYPLSEISGYQVTHKSDLGINKKMRYGIGINDILIPFSEHFIIRFASDYFTNF